MDNLEKKIKNIGEYMKEGFKDPYVKSMYVLVAILGGLSLLCKNIKGAHEVAPFGYILTVGSLPLVILKNYITGKDELKYKIENKG